MLRMSKLECLGLGRNSVFSHSESENKLAETLESNANNENSLNLKIASLEAQLADSLNKYYLTVVLMTDSIL